MRGVAGSSGDEGVMQIAEPQEILTPITKAAIFLTLTIDTGAEDAVRDVIADLNGLRRSVGFRIPEGGLTCVAGFGSAAWDRLFGGPRPARLHPFRALHGPKHTAPATRGDLFFHIRARRLDMCFELAQLLTDRLNPHTRVVDEVHGFRSFDERDLLGFVDGTENPDGAAARAAVLIGDEDAEFAGGAYLVVQKYVHDLQAWNALTVEQQERAFGRTKTNDVEFPDDVKASNSHVTLNTIVDANGEQHQIMRFNMPFGHVSTGEFGTYFNGYARSPEVLEQMLENMFIGKPPGNYDRILDFSTALTGNLFFIPTAGFLDDPPAPPSTASSDEEPASPETEETSAAAQVSLAIGSLKDGSR